MIEVNNVCAGYDEVQVLHHITFQLKEGEDLVIIGPNGCGKTTLLRAIANLIPFQGEIKINESFIQEMKRKELAKKIGMLSQTTQIYFNYTVFDTVMLGRYPYQEGHIFSENTKEDFKIVENALKVTGISELKNREINTLSGGQMQRVFLAKVIAQEPDIILLDEPTNHLDLSYQIELIQFLKNWKGKKRHSIIGVFHDINLAIMLTENILLLKEGKTAAYGKSKMVLTGSVLESVYGMDIVGFMRQSYQRWENMK